ncbi:MAG: KOW motif-containing protein [Anaerolineales bacterium]|nr:KOW motif-containing protein [Anaerolineales bacterium]MCB8991824.1 KOW motif-containing protein [Ardenticatenaceae bacterium]
MNKGDRIRVVSGDHKGRVGYIEAQPLNHKSKWRTVRLLGVRQWHMLETQEMELFPEEKRVVKL